MNYYEIEYTGSVSSQNVLGKSYLNLDEILNNPEPPKFIKIENICYYSQISKKYELFEKWDSKWDNEIWISTSSIISIRKIKGDLLSIAPSGEWNAFSEKSSLSIIVSSKFVESIKGNYEEYLLDPINQLVSEKAKHLLHTGGIKIIEQELLPKNEFIVTQFGNIIIRKSISDTNNIAISIIQELNKHFSIFSEKNED